MHSTHEVSGSLPRPLGRLSTAQCIEGSRRSTVISLAILVETSGCCLRGGKLIWSVSSPSGGAPDRSAPVQVCCGQASRCGGATGTPGPVDCRPGDGYPPYNALAASALPEELGT